MDTHMTIGYEVTSHYDSLLAKVICWGEDRNQALETSIRALSEMSIEGLPTNLPYLLRVLKSNEFIDGDITLESAFGEAAFTGLAPSYQG